jgi:NTE family protein
MKRKRIAIACQGGGSQCAFVAGALHALFAAGIDRQFEIVGLSGTSGGAITAAAAWIGLLKQADGDGTAIAHDIVDLWRDLTAQTPREIVFDHVAIQALRLAESGLVPSMASSPSSPQFQFLSRLAASFIGRPEFTDLRALLVKHFDFDELPSLVNPDSPVLLVGAADVLEGSFKVFSSARDEITLDALLASAAIPNLFPAVWVDHHAYWDGIFSSNPPVFGFLRKPLMGDHAVPQEIWIIQVNRTKSDSVPELPSDIFDRRNHLAGNLSLRHELEFIEIINLLVQEGALTDRFRQRLRLETTGGITVRFIRMSDELMRELDYPSKLSRQPAHIERLMAEGEAQATTFLSQLGEAQNLAEPTVEAPSAELH